MPQTAGPIGIFDSGYGGLTIYSRIQQLMPEYDYIYYGDNARTPYGTRSFEVVYQFTLQAVKQLFALGCNLVILACNTASAKALRTIQQHDLPKIGGYRRVLGVIRPTVESIGPITRTRHVGILGTTGTVRSRSYDMEIAKLFPDITVQSEACPLWVPLVEQGEYASAGADYFVNRHIQALLSRDPQIDTLVLGCTHYPLLMAKIRSVTPPHISIVAQGEYVAQSLRDYLHRHAAIDQLCSKGGATSFYTSESTDRFKESASIFLAHPIDVIHLPLQG